MVYLRLVVLSNKNNIKSYLNGWLFIYFERVDYKTEMGVSVSIKDVEPTKSFVIAMQTNIDYLKQKKALTEIDKRIIEAFDKYMSELEG